MLYLPKFIVLEGIDGAGTTTQANLLRGYFNDNGYPCMVSPEPTETELGALIRKMLSDPPKIKSERFDSMIKYLCHANRIEHLYSENNGVVTMLRRGVSVITPRYVLSTLAYNCTANNQRCYLNLSVKDEIIKPDLTIFLDTSLAISANRLGNRKSLDVYENQEKLRQVQENYQGLSNYFDLIVNGDQSKETVHQAIIDKLKHFQPV